MNTHRTIKATDIRVGDTIQWTTLVCGISAKWKMTVSRIAAGTDGNIEFFKVYNQQGGIRHFDADDEFYLVDRPAPKLPTKPGSLVYVEEFEGEEIEPPFLAFLDVKRLLEWRKALPWRPRMRTPARDHEVVPGYGHQGHTMSRGQLARTPNNFPRMKYRGSKRWNRSKAITLQMLINNSIFRASLARDYHVFVHIFPEVKRFGKGRS